MSTGQVIPTTPFKFNITDTFDPYICEEKTWRRKDGQKFQEHFSRMMLQLPAEYPRFFVRIMIDTEIGPEEVLINLPADTVDQCGSPGFIEWAVSQAKPSVKKEITRRVDEAKKLARETANRIIKPE